MRFEPAFRFVSGRTPLALIALALALYLPTIGWGVPRANSPERTKTYATDAILPLEALAEMHNTLIVSKPGRNYGYPWFHYAVVAGVQAPYLGYLLAIGEMAAPTPEYPFGLKDPVGGLCMLVLLGRLVSVLMAAGVVVSTYWFARKLWGHETGLIAALFGLVSYPMIYYSGVGNMDIPVTFWSAVGVAVFAYIIKEGLDVTRGVWLGIMAGLAMATKDQAVLSFLPLGLALLFPAIGRAPDARSRTRALGAALAASIVAYLFGTGMWIDPQRHITHVDSLFFHTEKLSIARLYFSPHPISWAGAALILSDALTRAVDAFGGLTLLAGALGAVQIARRNPSWLVLLAPLPLLIALLFVPTGTVVLRYYLPFGLLVDGAAAHGVWSLRETPLRRAALPLVVLMIGLRLAPGVDLSYAQLNETRSAAGDWFAAHAMAGDRIEHFGPSQKLPPLSADVRALPLAGRKHWRGEFDHGPRVIDYLQKNGPEYVVVIPDWTSRATMDRSADCPPEVLEALLDGSVGYRLVADFGEPALMPALLARPPLDSKQVAPRVRIFARADIATRPARDAGAASG